MVVEIAECAFVDNLMIYVKTETDLQIWHPKNCFGKKNNWIKRRQNEVNDNIEKKRNKNNNKPRRKRDGTSNSLKASGSKHKN